MSSARERIEGLRNRTGPVRPADVDLAADLALLGLELAEELQRDAVPADADMPESVAAGPDDSLCMCCEGFNEHADLCKAAALLRRAEGE